MVGIDFIRYREHHKGDWKRIASFFLWKMSLDVFFRYNFPHRNKYRIRRWVMPVWWVFFFGGECDVGKRMNLWLRAKRGVYWVKISRRERPRHRKMLFHMGWRVETQRLDARRCLNQGQSCGCCIRQQRFEFGVPDEEWAKVVPDEMRDCALCIECYLRFATLAGIENPDVTTICMEMSNEL